MSITVQDLLRGKSAVYSVGPDATVYDALRVMADKNIGAVIVLSDQLVEGIFSVEPGWSVEQCMALMTEKRIRHLPVMDQGRLVGVVSIGDVVRALVDEQQFTIDSLQRYISS
jgi:CBS domain-containing protein